MRAQSPTFVHFVPFLLVLAVLVEAHEARACAVCASLDPTPSAAGAEQPFANRLRLDLESLAGAVTEAEPDGHLARVSDLRLAATLAYAPRPSLLLSVVAPVLDREVETATTHLHAWVAGDLDARAYARVWRSADQRRWLALFAGTKVPTAPVEGNGSGSPLPSELQPGCSSIAPYLGAAYGGRVGILSGQVSADVYVPFSVRSAPHPGDSLRASAWLQAALTRKIASRGGISARVDGTGELSPNLPDPNSGGAIVYATTDILVTPVEDLVLSVGASFPAVQAWLGIHRETAIGSVHVAYDF